MPTTVQIPDLDDGVHAVLVRRAAAAGVNVPELLRAEITRLVAASSVEEWLQRTRRHSSPFGRLEVLSALDEQRSSWPDVGR